MSRTKSLANPYAHLRNKLSRDDALKRLEAEPFERKTVSFYRYVVIDDPTEMRHRLFAEWRWLGVLGRTYLAAEGINAQISVPEPNWEAFVETLYAHPEFADMPFKIAVEAPVESFIKLTIKIKKQIVADGLTPNDYDITNVGTHLEPEDFHNMMEEPDTVVVDMRNHYESEIGRFEGAICPDVDTFREELPAVRDLLQDHKDKRVLLYCTGGIRCEKASAYLKHEGFENVYQLHGGIINYAHEMKAKGLESKFKGKNFVFDGRRAERITDDVLSQCHLCGTACDDHVNCSNEMCNLLLLQCADCGIRLKGACSEECARIAALPEEKRRELRKQFQKPHTLDQYRKSLRPTERVL